jgi:hypothetical protein
VLFMIYIAIDNVNVPGVVLAGLVYVNTVYPGAEAGVVTAAPGAVTVGYTGVGTARITVPFPPVPPVKLEQIPPPPPPPPEFSVPHPTAVDPGDGPAPPRPPPPGPPNP